MNAVRFFAVSALVAVMSGCASSPRHSCALTNEEGYCANMEETYSAAVQGNGSHENVLAGGGKSVSPRSVSGEAVFTGYPQAEARGMPVYTPPKPHRLWIAPWAEANGVLHGGEYVYYTTPGYWNYGTLGAPGEGSTVLGPVRPQDLGFQPVTDQNALENGRIEQRNGVVQPYQQMVPAQ